MNVDSLAITLTFGLGFCFLAALLVYSLQYRLLKKKIFETKKTNPSWESECFTEKWYQKSTIRKIIAARGIFIPILWVGSFVIAGLVFWIFSTLGYAMLIALFGFMLFLDEDGSIAFYYTLAVLREHIEKLQPLDIRAMEETSELLLIRIARYFLLTICALVIAFFVPVIFQNFVLIAFLFLPIEYLGNLFGFPGMILGVLIIYVLPMAFLCHLLLRSAEEER